MAQRKLAAIMFSDIVGYSSLLKEDENKAFETRKKNQRIHKRLIKKFNGRWLKEMESGTLACFSSNIDAVMCAVSIQKATEEINIPLRIGIHQGDVIFEKKDVLGDGVNIASRIQRLADSNDIVISEKVYDDIKNKGGLTIELLGERSLKEVKKSTSIYKVSSKDENFQDLSIDTGELIRPMNFGRTAIVFGIMVIALISYVLFVFIPLVTTSSESKKRVLILPPENNLGTDSLNYVVAGMHDALIGDMGKIGALSVISRTSAVAYLKEGKSISEMASEHNIDYIIESSVLCYDDSVCTQFKVFDGEENELSIQDFSVEKSQILSLYKNVTEDIAKRINIVLTPETERLLAKSRTVDKDAYDAYLKSLQFFGDGSYASINKTIEYFNIAIEKDPDWAPLYSGLARTWATCRHLSCTSPAISTRQIYLNLNKALELDPDLSDAHAVNAFIAQSMEWDWEKSEKEFLRTLALNPNDAETRMLYAQFLCTMQRPDEALTQGKWALELDPLNPMIKVWYGAALTMVGDCKTAMAVLEEVLAVDPEHHIANSAFEEAAFQCGNYERAFEASMIIQKNIFEEDIIIKLEKIFEERGYAAAYRELVSQLESFAETNHFGAVAMAINYTKVNQLDKAMDWLEKGYEMHDTQMIYIATHQYNWDPLFDNPRFIDIVEKMKLPLP